MDVYFKLKSTITGVRLIATDKKGELLPSGNILEIKSNGTLQLFPDVNMLLGLRLDSALRITLQD
jgi:hypothetical protein